ncbi:uncharacterized protein wu:fa19b12 [Sebastes umbrosus]|uniref:uncharacterized protein wu:fa19b12 n=1 Tax=Sebastes umbrosus TaxID=72105 RepID=UPI0018A04EB2|nr:uncharacterized protein wu:fa19b12 [Sebastes umbrosus]
MAKRSAEDTLLLDSASRKRHCSLISGVDLQLESMSPTGGVSPPSLQDLMGSRCGKRPHYFEDPEKQEEEEAAALFFKPTHCDTRKHAAPVLTVQTSGSFQDRHTSSSTPTSSKKRPRDDCSDTVTPKDKAEEDTNSEDCTFNSFQYWRVPLPELNLSLLEDASDRSQTKDEESKVKDSSSDAMET